MENYKELLKEINSDYLQIRGSLNLAEKQEKLLKLQEEAQNPDLWNDTQKAKKLMQAISNLKNELDEVEKIDQEIKALLDLESAEEFEEEINGLKKKIDSLRVKTYFKGGYDDKNAIISIHAGQGGTEAMDWVSMLYRMYLRYCEKRNWQISLIDSTAGEEAGIKSTTFKVEGAYAYGSLKNESGTHRLVRQSPFNADKLRQTSFALVEVLPELEEVDLPDIQIKDEDLEWQFFRSSSQGGQNVQKVSTAVRVKHIPTGIVVTAQAERFQEQNRKNALNLLRARLWLVEQERKKQEMSKLKGEYRPASWGTQIRSYVLHPYKMVKDLRTQVETSNTEGVLAGELDEFIEAELKLNT